MSLGGCGGRLCRALKLRASKFDCTRYLADEFGSVDLSSVELSYKICGRICGKIGKSSSGGVDIPGRLSGNFTASLELLVIMSSAEIKFGDVICDGENYYRIAGKICDDPQKFELERINIDNDGETSA